MSYSHLSIIERGQIEALHRLGWSTRKIGKQLGRHHSTIARELGRGQVNACYEAASAQDAYQERRASCVPAGKFTPELAAKLQEKLEQTWSPEQIAERRRCEGQAFVCFKTIYRWLYDGKLTVCETKVLRHKGKRRKPIETRGRFTVGTPIRQRPKEVRKRSTFGHWELDTIVSSRGKSKACVATFIERKTRLYFAVKMPDRTAHSMEIAFGVAASQYPKGTFKTATTDRGKEL